MKNVQRKTKKKATCCESVAAPKGKTVQRKVIGLSRSSWEVTEIAVASVVRLVGAGQGLPRPGTAIGPWEVTDIAVA